MLSRHLSHTTHDATRSIARIDSITHLPPPLANAPAPAINTILAVREHAPAEIEELNVLIQALHNRLGGAYARKHLLERMLTVIRESDGNGANTSSGMAVVR